MNVNLDSFGDMESLIFENIQEILSSPSQLQEYIKRVTSFTKEDADDVLLTCSKGNKADFYKFASWPVGIVGQNTTYEEITLEYMPDNCFKQVNVTFNRTSGNSYEIIFTPGSRQGNSKCSDVYTIATPSQFKMIDLRKEHKVVKNKLTQQQLENIQTFGLRIYRACDKFAHLIPDILLTLGLYVGGLGKNPFIPFFGSKPTWWQQKLNPEFVLQGAGYQWQKRKDIFVDLNDTEVHSGDFLIITRMDGLDQLIQWGTGSRSGHSVVLLEFDGEMYAIESQAAWYWPKDNIQRTPWKKWKKYAKNAGFNVALLPLSDEKRKQFNITAATEFFKSLEGTPYGFHNFIFGWMDTPDQNLPPITSLDFIYVIASMIERFYAPPIQQVFGEGLNKRLGTQNLTLAQIADVASRKGMSVADLFAIPELDSWIYSDGKSYVCSAFVAGVYKAGGLFNGKNIQATEFTPRDVYQMNFFNTTVIRPQACIDADPELPYCQIMGNLKMDIRNDGYSTYEPYDNMFETCPSQPPNYYKTPMC